MSMFCDAALPLLVSAVPLHPASAMAMTDATRTNVCLMEISPSEIETRPVAHAIRIDEVAHVAATAVPLSRARAKLGQNCRFRFVAQRWRRVDVSLGRPLCDNVAKSWEDQTISVTGSDIALLRSVEVIPRRGE